ncbi:MAG: hypothetical protein CMJ49_12990 [Planctomycetaceae bacterium]|nr:hypothetical protein [Planctomycetaceae bacterium]
MMKGLMMDQRRCGGRRHWVEAGRWMRWVAALLMGMATLTVVGCMSLAQIAPPVDVLDRGVVGDSGIEVGALVRGRDHYLRHCGNCHALEPIGDYSEADWRGILPGMIKRCRLDAVKAEELRDYVMVVRGHLDRRG